MAAEQAEARKRHLIQSGTEPASDDLALRDVEAAAVEAGIGAEFVQVAIAEIEGESAVQPPPSSWVSRAAGRLLGHPPRVIEAARTLPASPQEVYAAMQRIFPNPPFGLVLRDTLGTDLFTDGVLVFETDITTAKTKFELQLEFGDIKRILTTIRPASDRADACDVTLRAPVGRLGLNVVVGGGFTGAGAGGGLAAGAAAAPEFITLLGIGAGLTSLFTAVAAIATGAAAGGLVLAAYRGLYRWGMRQGRQGLENLLQALTVDIRTQGAFAPRALRDQPASGALPGSDNS